MRRCVFAIVLVVGLGLALAGTASADPWPDWSATNNPFSFTVTAVQTATGYDYTVNVDPTNLYPGWGIKAFVVYFDNVTTQLDQASTAYDGGNTAGWDNLNGGWEKDKYPGPAGTTAAIGWQTGSPTGYVFSGSSATFHAIDLPDGFENFSLHYAVHVVPTEGDTYWSNGGNSVVPEPGSLLLLGLGLGAVGAFRRRHST